MSRKKGGLTGGKALPENSIIRVTITTVIDTNLRELIDDNGGDFGDVIQKGQEYGSCEVTSIELVKGEES